MNLTAHPLSVAAELAWKGDLLGGANLATRHRVPRRRRRWPAWPARLGASGRPTSPGRDGTPRHTPRPA
jgi:hypothetical protein